MKELTDKEFEEHIKKLINKDITRVDLAKELKTDTRTLANRIYKINNQELLKQYLEEFPYKPRKNENINYENLIIEIVKYAEKAADVQAKYDIAERTYRRNIERIKISNPKLYQIYKDYIHSTLSYDEKEYIDNLEEGKVSVTNSTEDRKAQLIDLFRYYDALLAIGLDTPEAIGKLEETPRSLKRKSDELDRILKEEDIKHDDEVMKKTAEKRRKENFTNSLKIDSTQLLYTEKNKDVKEVEREL